VVKLYTVLHLASESVGASIFVLPISRDNRIHTRNAQATPAFP
jgi:hypothetical protein